MREAKNYPNTIELVAEKYYKKYIKWRAGGIYPCWKNLDENCKEQFRVGVIIVLDSVNYFEVKTCKDCGYLDLKECMCFGEDREHKEFPENAICSTFAPRNLVESTC